MANTVELYGLMLEFEDEDNTSGPHAILQGLQLEFEDEDNNPTSPAFFYGLQLEFGEVSLIVPEPAFITGNIEGQQTAISTQWSIPTITEYIGEYLGIATGGEDQFILKYANPTDTPSNPFEIYEETSDGTTYSTLTDGTALAGDIRIPVIDSSAIPLYSWIKIENDEGIPLEYNRIVTQEDTEIKLQYPLTFDIAQYADLLIRKVWVEQKYDSTDFDFDATVGLVETITGHFTNGNNIFARYKFELDRLDHFEIWRVDGTDVVEYGAIYSDVISKPSSILINGSISSTTNNYDISVSSSDCGRVFSFYLFGIDGDGNKSRAQRLLQIETIPSIPANLNSDIDDVTMDVAITFDAVNNPTANGVNLYRCAGPWDGALSIKLNTSLITDTEFIDGPSNLTNRVSAAVAPYPSTGNRYFYRPEREDTVSDWDTGTQNAVEGQSEITTATRIPESAPEEIPGDWTDIPPE